jgi:hypothetical protein
MHRLLPVSIVLLALSAGCRGRSSTADSPPPSTGAGAVAESTEVADPAPRRREALAPSSGMASVLVDREALPSPAAPSTEDCAALRAALTAPAAREGSAAPVDEVEALAAGGPPRGRGVSLRRIEGVGSGSQALVPALRRVAATADPAARSYAVDLLRAIDPAVALEVAAAMVADPDSEVRIRTVGAAQLARSGPDGLARLVTILRSGDPSRTRQLEETLDRSISYPLAATALLADDGYCVSLEAEACRATVRWLAAADPAQTDALELGSATARLLEAEAEADIDAAALGRWASLAGDSEVSLPAVRESVIALRGRGMMEELVPGWARLLESGRLLGPRHSAGLMPIAPALAGSLPALEDCALGNDNEESAAYCFAAWVAAGGGEPSDALARRARRLVSEAGTRQHAVARTLAMAIGRLGPIDETEAWVGRLDMPTLNLVRAMQGDADAAARALSDDAVDLRVALHGIALWSAGRGGELARAAGSALAESPDHRWLEWAAVRGGEYSALAPALGARLATLEDAVPSTRALVWLAAMGEREAAAAWIDGALRSGLAPRIQTAALAARRIGLGVAPERMIELIAAPSSGPRIEVAAYREDLARTLLAQGGIGVREALDLRARIADGSAGFTEAGMLGLHALRRCE